MKRWIGGFLLSIGIIILTGPMIYEYFNPEIIPIKVYSYSPSKKPSKGRFEETVYEKKAKPEKDWIEYGDKIVGWIVSLSGAIVLICNARNKKGEI